MKILLTVADLKAIGRMIEASAPEHLTGRQLDAALLVGHRFRTATAPMMISEAPARFSDHNEPMAETDVQPSGIEYTPEGKVRVQATRYTQGQPQPDTPIIDAEHRRAKEHAKLQLHKGRRYSITYRPIGARTRTVEIAANYLGAGPHEGTHAFDLRPEAGTSTLYEDQILEVVDVGPAKYERS